MGQPCQMTCWFPVTLGIVSCVLNFWWWSAYLAEAERARLLRQELAARELEIWRLRKGKEVDG